MAEAVAENAGGGAAATKEAEKLPPHLRLSPAELAAQGRAPVKLEFLKYPNGWGPRAATAGARAASAPSSSVGPASAAEEGHADVAASAEEPQNVRAEGEAPHAEGAKAPEEEGAGAGGGGAGAGGAQLAQKKDARVGTEKLSRNQWKKRRKQVLKTQVCNAVARTGDPASCPFGDQCRYSHDVETAIKERLPDLPGNCPFGSRCPYGLTCRFLGSHSSAQGSNAELVGAAKGADAGALAANGTEPAAASEAGGQAVAASSTNGACSGHALPSESSAHESGKACGSFEVLRGERNELRKELQQQLWKRTIETPRAAEALAAIGWKRKEKKRGRDALMADDDEDAGVEDGDGEAAGGQTTHDDVGEQRTSSPKASLSKGAEEPLGACAPQDSVAGDAGVGKEAHEDGARGSYSGEQGEAALRRRERRTVDLAGKIVLAPLTTVGNLPFRRVLKEFGADVTVGEMALCPNLLQGQASEWALLRRHKTEDCFGIQICGAHPDMVARTCEVVAANADVDFIDINMGCPIDLITDRGFGSALLCKPQRLEQVVRAAALSMDTPLTVKMRMAFLEGKNCAHKYISSLAHWGACAVTLHGRSRQQRYSRSADWDYIRACAAVKPEGLALIGNGDIFSFTDWNQALGWGDQEDGGSGARVDAGMVARGALIKPWLPTEIKEQRHWDISATERFEILKTYTSYGLTHWGSDTRGVETTRKFLLEWLSYLHRYIPVGLLEVLPQKLNWRPPAYFGRTDLETLMASDQAVDWIKISEMLLGPTPPGFTFVAKHKSNAYDKAENG